MEDHEISALLRSPQKQEPLEPHSGSRPVSRGVISRPGSRPGTNQRQRVLSRGSNRSPSVAASPTREVEEQHPVNNIPDDILHYYESFKYVQEQIVLHCLATIKHVNTTHQLALGIAKSTAFNQIVDTSRSNLSRGTQHFLSSNQLHPLETRPFTVGFIGCGTIGQAVVLELLKSQMLHTDSIRVSTRQPENLQHIADQGVTVYQDNARLIEECTLVFLCVLPHQLPAVAASLPQLKPTTTVKFSSTKDLDEKEAKDDLGFGAGNAEGTEDDGAVDLSSLRMKTQQRKVAEEVPPLKFPLYMSLLSTTPINKIQQFMQTSHVTRTRISYPSHPKEQFAANVEQQTSDLTRELTGLFAPSNPQLTDINEKISCMLNDHEHKYANDLLNGYSWMYRPKKLNQEVFDLGGRSLQLDF